MNGSACGQKNGTRGTTFFSGCGLLIKKPTAAQRGFTLIELLIVMAILSLIIALSAHAFGSAGQAAALNRAGMQVTQLIEFARQRAMSGNAMTALILVTDHPDGSLNGNTLALMERRQDMEWLPISEWERLPEGIGVDLDAHAADGSYLPPSTPGLLGSKGPHPCLGVSNYAYTGLIFRPQGGLFPSGASVRLKLVINGANPSPANYYRITILGATGKTKIDRP